MKRSLTLWVIFLLSALITGCANTRSPYLNSKLATENWRQYIDTNPSLWANGASRWFLTGEPNPSRYKDQAVLDAKAVTTMKVDASPFTKIVANGDFQLQIFGSYGQDTVFAYGPQNDLRQLEIRSERGTLFVRQTKEAKSTIRNVIVRVGVGSLSRLERSGGGTTEAIQLPASVLDINASGAGNMYLSGNVELRRVNNAGTATVSVFGARTPTLDITTASMGSVNVSGDIGIHSITHHGKGNVNIIGANSDSLIINTDGSGKIGISGIVNVKEIQARDNTSVYIDCVNGNGLYVYAMQQAKVGLTGNTQNLYMYASGVSIIYGRTMYAQSTYAQARDGSHINAAATNKIFASASDNASVYFFGEPQLMSQFVSGNGVVIPVWTGGERKYPGRLTAKFKDAPPKKLKYKWVNGKMVVYEPHK